MEKGGADRGPLVREKDGGKRKEGKGIQISSTPWIARKEQRIEQMEETARESQRQKVGLALYFWENKKRVTARPCVEYR